MVATEVYAVCVNRWGRYFPDQINVQCYIGNDGEVSGHTRDISKWSPFVPFEFWIPIETVGAIRDAFEVASSPGPHDATISARCTGRYAEWGVKHFSVSNPPGAAANADCGSLIESISQQAIQATRRSR